MLPCAFLREQAQPRQQGLQGQTDKRATNGGEATHSESRQGQIGKAEGGNKGQSVQSRLSFSQDWEQWPPNSVR